MRRRWIADEVNGDRATLVGEHATHLARVLRARVGQEFDVATGERVRRGRVLSVSDERVEFELGEDVPVAPEPQVMALLSIFKFDRMEWVIEKATELGATRIVPVIARRTDKHLAAVAQKRVERWRRLAREAAQQSRRATAPQIDDPIKLKDAIGAAQGRRIVLAESEEDTSLKDAIGLAAGDAVWLAFGPEGGWTTDEMRLFSEAGWVSASLGPNILRAETAVIAALVIVMAELREGKAS